MKMAYFTKGMKVRLNASHQQHGRGRHSKGRSIGEIVGASHTLGCWIVRWPELKYPETLHENWLEPIKGARTINREIVIRLLPREDGGLRVCSDDVPGLILSGPNPAAVMSDVWPALLVLTANKSPSPTRCGETMTIEGAEER
jgi:hypothetical protein